MILRICCFENLNIYEFWWFLMILICWFGDFENLRVIWGFCGFDVFVLCWWFADLGIQVFEDFEGLMIFRNWLLGVWGFGEFEEFYIVEEVVTARWAGDLNRVKHGVSKCDVIFNLF